VSRFNRRSRCVSKARREKVIFGVRAAHTNRRRVNQVPSVTHEDSRKKLKKKKRKKQRPGTLYLPTKKYTFLVERKREKMPRRNHNNQGNNDENGAVGGGHYQCCVPTGCAKKTPIRGDDLSEAVKVSHEKNSKSDLICQ
jgi:hypothetical protein